MHCCNRARALVQQEGRHLPSRYDTLSALFKQSTQAQDQWVAVDQAFDDLTKLGAFVKPSDVIDKMGELLAGAHVTAETLARIAGTMPAQGGPALGRWVADMSAQHDQKMQQAQQIHEQLRGQLGQEAFGMLHQGVMSGGAPTTADEVGNA